MKMDNLRDVFKDQLRDIYDAENQLTKALPKMAEAATAQDLKRALQQHLDVTKRQKERVQQLMQNMDIKAGGKTCKAMQGLIEEGDEMAKNRGDSDAVDAGIVAAAQKVEHYEMATYGSLRTWAQTLGENDAARVLQEILDEESEANETLTQIAEGHLNPSAAR